MSDIDNKTKAVYARQLAEILERNGENQASIFLKEIAERFDPPEKPIHPHDGCEGMVVHHVDDNNPVLFKPEIHTAIRYQFFNKPSKIPAFLCDGTKPEWVMPGWLVWFIKDGGIIKARSVEWEYKESEYFCVLNPVEVQ